MTTTEDITTEHGQTTEHSQTDGSDAATAPGGLDLARLEEFAGMVSMHQSLANNAALAYIGDRLGLWQALASVPTVTSEELAERTGLSERYLREWLAAQAAAGYVLYEPSTRRFRFPAEHAAVLADDSSPAALAGGFEMNAAVFAGSDRLAHAFATGEGISYAEQDPRVAAAVERFFRPLYEAALVDQWLPAVDGLVDRLRSGVRVLDVGCGLGTATLMLAALGAQAGPERLVEVFAEAGLPRTRVAASTLFNLVIEARV